MKIAIVGAGYAGLSIAWHMLQMSNVTVSLFDPKGIGEGTSGVSTGLLHPYPAKNMKRSLRAEDAMKASVRLIEVAEQALGRPVAVHTGILRLAQSQELEERLSVWNREQILSLHPQICAEAGLWIPEGKTVFSKLYLEGLWRACKSKGAEWLTQSISRLEELQEFDRIVIACGSEVLQFEECRALALKTRKGQALLCRWPASLMPLPCSLIGTGHLSLTEDPTLYYLGSTYEEEFDSSSLIALQEKISLFFPPVCLLEILEVRRGVRIAPKTGYLPLIQKISPKAWVFTGLGSRGLLYHALYGQELAQLLISKT